MTVKGVDANIAKQTTYTKSTVIIIGDFPIIIAASIPKFFRTPCPGSVFYNVVN
jgi:hypothetical protein